MSEKIPIFDQSGTPLGTLETAPVGSGLENGLAAGVGVAAVGAVVGTALIATGLLGIAADTFTAAGRKDFHTVRNNIIAISAVLFIIGLPCWVAILAGLLNKLMGQ